VKVGRALLLAVLAVAALSAALASAGVAVAPHVDPPGTPRLHVHVLAAYRYPAFLMHIAAQLDHGPRFALTTPFELGAGLVLATLALQIPRLPRPSRRAIATLAPYAARAQQWRPDLPQPPPRALALRPLG
jgi:hypothetical protein